MRTVNCPVLDRAAEQVAEDLRTDPYLAPILVLATVLCGFWFWHRIPNFATRDEQERLLDALVTYGTFLDDPGIGSLRAGVSWGRVPFGATLYLFGITALPVVTAAVLTGQLDAILELQDPGRAFGFYPAWNATPRWVWVWSLALVRSFNVVLAVGCVYLTYRLGVVGHSRAVGRLAAVILTLTFGFLVIAHEGGEDMPALFFILLALYAGLRYAQTGRRLLFLAGSAVGGIAIAFKLTAAPIVLLVGVAYSLRARNATAAWVRELWQPSLVVGGAIAGLAGFLLGYPEALVGGHDLVIDRVVDGSMDRTEAETGPDAPTWWWFLRNYLDAFGLPLFTAAVLGVLGRLTALRWRDPDFDVAMLSVVGLAAYLLLYGQWHDFRTHHLLPTFPLIALLLSTSLVRLRTRRPPVGTPVVVVLLVLTGVYAGVGTAGYASMPRDQAEVWLEANAEEDDTMEVYTRVMQDAAIPHGMDIVQSYQSEDVAARETCPAYIQLTYRDLLHLGNDPAVDRNDRHAAYIRSLLDGEYGYEIAAEFGDRPQAFVPQRPQPGSLVEVLEVGIIPQSPEYADEQELAPEQYTVILKRTGACERPYE